MTQAADRTEMPAKEPQTFREKVEAGRFVMTAEVDPPHGLAAKKAVEGAKLLKDAGADAVNVGGARREHERRCSRERY